MRPKASVSQAGRQPGVSVAGIPEGRRGDRQEGMGIRPSTSRLPASHSRVCLHAEVNLPPPDPG